MRAQFFLYSQFDGIFICPALGAFVFARKKQREKECERKNEQMNGACGLLTTTWFCWVRQHQHEGKVVKAKRARGWTKSDEMAGTQMIYGILCGGIQHSTLLGILMDERGDLLDAVNYARACAML